MALDLHSKLAPDTEESLLQSKNAAAGGRSDVPNLPDMIEGYQRAWYQRFNNLGGGNKNALSWATTLLLPGGGLLGSYGLSREATVNRQIDEVVFAKTGIDFDATHKLTDIFTGASDKVRNLTAKIDVCETLEGDIGEYIEQNKRSIELFDGMRKAIDPGIIGRIREGIANTWEKAKGGAVATAAVGGGAIAYTAGPMAFASGIGAVVGKTGTGVAMGAGFLTEKLGALGAAAISNPLWALVVVGGVAIGAGLGINAMIKNTDSLKKLKATMEMLRKMKASIAHIKTKTKEQRDKLFAKAMKKYGPEQQVEKNLRELIKLRDPASLFAFESALQANDEGALNAILTDMQRKGALYDPAEVQLVKRYFQVMLTQRSKNLRRTAELILGEKDVEGMGNVGRLTERLAEVDKLTGVRGKMIVLDGSLKGNFVLTDMITEGSERTLILQDAADVTERAALKFKKQGDKYTEVKFVRSTRAFKDIAAELSGLTPPPGNQKIADLLQKGQKTFLKQSEYAELATAYPAATSVPNIHDMKTNVFEEHSITEPPPFKFQIF